MELWQAREKHAVEVEKILIAEGCIGPKSKMLRAWHGQKSQDALEAGGHSGINFKDCKCSKDFERFFDTF